MEKKTVVMVSEEELIKEAEGLLIKSGNAAKGRTKTRQGYINKGIKYELKTGKKLVEQIKRELPNKWEKWVDMTRNYLSHGKKRRDRPTIDRRSSYGDYCLANIDFLTSYEHDLKDNSIGIIVYDLQKESYMEYITMTKASKVLKCTRDTVSKYCGSGVLFQNRYLVQSEGEKQGQNNNKRKRMQKMLAVSNVIMNEYDDDGNVVREFPAQLKSIVSFPKLEIKRHGI